MARPRIDRFWIDKIEQLHGTAPHWSAAKITLELEKEKPNAPTGPPSSRAVLRAMNEFDEKQPSEQMRFHYFHWPTSMVSGALPWEAARVGLDFLRSGYRPLIREVESLYRIGLAAPSLTAAEQMFVSHIYLLATYAMETGSERDRILEAVERMLANQKVEPIEKFQILMNPAAEAKLAEVIQIMLQQSAPQKGKKG